MTLEERMKQKLAGIKKQEETLEIIEENNSTTTLSENINYPIASIYNKEDFNFIDELIEEEELRNFLKEKTATLLSTERLTKVVLGKILNEIFEKIGNYKNGTWTKWCREIGLNDRTALRYRNRATFFEEIKSIDGKKVALILSQEAIELILNESELKTEVLEALEHGADEKVVTMFIKKYKMKALELPEAPKEEKEDRQIKIENIVTTVETNWDNFDSKKQNKIKSLFLKIEKIINS